MLFYDILVVGAGIAGISAALSAYDGGIESILVVDSKDYAGGILPQCIHKGFGNGLSGSEYIQSALLRLNDSGIDLMLESTVLNISDKKLAQISTKRGIIEVSFKKLVLATGCSEISFGQMNISGTRPSGIYTAGQMQEMINLMHMDIGDDAVIVGCGNLGMIIARRLVLSGKKVVCVIEKEKKHSGLKRNYTQCIEKYGIKVYFSTQLKKVYGQDNISAVELSDGRIISCKTLVIACGMKEETSLIDSLGDKDWIYRCGNCFRVHDMVESAVLNAVETGKRVSEDVTGEGSIQ